MSVTTANSVKSVLASVKAQQKLGGMDKDAKPEVVHCYDEREAVKNLRAATWHQMKNVFLADLRMKKRGNKNHEYSTHEVWSEFKLWLLNQAKAKTEGATKRKVHDGPAAEVQGAKKAKAVAVAGIPATMDQKLSSWCGALEDSEVQEKLVAKLVENTSFINAVVKAVAETPTFFTKVMQNSHFQNAVLENLVKTALKGPNTADQEESKDTVMEEGSSGWSP